MREPTTGRQVHTCPPWLRPPSHWVEDHWGLFVGAGGVLGGGACLASWNTGWDLLNLLLGMVLPLLGMGLGFTIAYKWNDWFCPKWMHSSQSERALFVRYASDEIILGRIAVYDFAEGVRLDAVKRIANPSILAEVARHCSTVEVVRSAIARIDDQTLLIDLAQNASLAEAREAAVGRVGSKEVLADIARNDANARVRSAAALLIGDKASPAHMGRTDVVPRSAGATTSAASPGGEVVFVKESAAWGKPTRFFRAPNKAIAREFLKKTWRPLGPDLIVQTPEGDISYDAIGFQDL